MNDTEFDKASKLDYLERREVATDTMKTFAIKRIKQQLKTNDDFKDKNILTYDFSYDERKKMLKLFNSLAS